MVGWLALMGLSVALIVWGAELFAEHLAAAASRLGVSAFALALLLAGAEPEELATVVTASVRGVDGVALGDVIGANAAVVTVALGVGALVATVPFGARVRRYALGGLAASLVSGIVVWDGTVSRPEGVLLVLGYVAFVAVIWILERKPPSLGETGELDEVPSGTVRVGREFALVVVGLASLTVGSMALVEGVRRLSGIESTQTRLGLVVVGFATAFELVVLAWSSARRGITDAVVAAVVGSYAYNLTMSLGAGAVVAPIAIGRPEAIRLPFVAMAVLLVLVLGFAFRRGALARRDAVVLLLGYPVFVVVALVA
jgi:cation:H+ antiporter